MRKFSFVGSTTTSKRMEVTEKSRIWVVMWLTAMPTEIFCKALDLPSKRNILISIKISGLSRSLRPVKGKVSSLQLDLMASPQEIQD